MGLKFKRKVYPVTVCDGEYFVRALTRAEAAAVENSEVVGANGVLFFGVMLEKDGPPAFGPTSDDEGKPLPVPDNFADVLAAMPLDVVHELRELIMEKSSPKKS